MSNFGESAITSPLSAFGELLVVPSTPIMQITGVYNNTRQTMTSVTGTGATAEISQPFMQCSSGTTTGGIGFISTNRQLTYRSGQGLCARWTALYASPIAGNTQQSGMISSTDRITVGYNDAQVFGIFHFYHGSLEIQTLTITTASTASENATVTVDGTGYTVPITNATAKVNAQEIAASLNAQVSLYTFTSNDDTVVARADLAVTAGSFAFSSGTAVGAWASVSSGAVATEDFIPQTTWNMDTRTDLDPTKGNVWQVAMQYLGFGAIVVYVEDNDSGAFVPIHKIKWANQNTNTTSGNPTYRIGWVSENTTGTTDVLVKGATAAGFVQGPIHRNEATRGGEATNPSVSTTELTILSVRNRQVFGGCRNRVDVYGKVLSMSTDAGKDVIITIYSNPVLASDIDWTYIEEAESVMEVSTDNVAVTSGDTQLSLTIPAGGGTLIELDQILPLILPDMAVSITARVVSGAAGSVSVGLVWQEDLT